VKSHPRSRDPKDLVRVELALTIASTLTAAFGPPQPMATMLRMRQDAPFRSLASATNTAQVGGKLSAIDWPRCRGVPIAIITAVSAPFNESRILALCIFVICSKLAFHNNPDHPNEEVASRSNWV
jgi:hypothetical protein